MVSLFTSTSYTLCGTYRYIAIIESGISVAIHSGKFVVAWQLSRSSVPRMEQLR